MVRLFTFNNEEGNIFTDKCNFYGTWFFVIFFLTEVKAKSVKASSHGRFLQ